MTFTVLYNIIQMYNTILQFAIWSKTNLLKYSFFYYLIYRFFSKITHIFFFQHTLLDPLFYKIMLFQSTTMQKLLKMVKNSFKYNFFHKKFKFLKWFPHCVKNKNFHKPNFRLTLHMFRINMNFFCTKILISIITTAF